MGLKYSPLRPPHSKSAEHQHHQMANHHIDNHHHHPHHNNDIILTPEVDRAPTPEAAIAGSGGMASFTQLIRNSLPSEHSQDGDEPKLVKSPSILKRPSFQNSRPATTTTTQVKWDDDLMHLMPDQLDDCYPMKLTVCSRSDCVCNISACKAVLNMSVYKHVGKKDLSGSNSRLFFISLHRTHRDSKCRTFQVSLFCFNYRKPLFRCDYFFNYY